MTSRRRPPSAQAVDAVLGPPETAWVGGARTEVDGHSARGGHAARDQRHLLLPTLHAVQARVGWISPGALGYVCRRLTIPPAEAYGVASFYALFSLEPRPPVVTHVCTDIACMCRGGNELVAELERTVGPAGAHPGNGRAIWLESPCLGPVRARAGGARDRGRRGARSSAPSPPRAPRRSPTRSTAGCRARWCPTRSPQRGGDVRLLRRAGVVDPESLDSYRAHGGYEALRQALALGQAGVIREVTESKLLGRGGAAFPTGRKWDAVARNPVGPRLPDLQRRRVRAGHVQGPDRVRAGSLRGDRGDDDRRVRLRMRARIRVPARRVPAGLGPAGERRHRGPQPRPPGRRHHGPRPALRHRAAQGRGRIHLRRGDRALQLHRGLPRRAAQQAAVPGRRRPVRQADRRQQRRDAGERARHRHRGRPRVRGHRHRAVDRHAALLPLGLRRAAGPVRGAVRHQAAAT